MLMLFLFFFAFIGGGIEYYFEQKNKEPKKIKADKSLKLTSKKTTKKEIVSLSHSSLSQKLWHYSYKSFFRIANSFNMTRDRRLSWINGLLLPLFNVLTAFIATGIVFLFIGVDPIEATKILLYGALGYDEGLGYTLYYATNFVFTGLAVAVAFHAGLFNIGGEGQAYVGGLGIALVALYINPAMSAWIVI